MGLQSLQGASDFTWQTSNIISVRPAAAWGTSVTMTNGSKGSWVGLLSGAEVANDVYGIQLNINSNTTAATARTTAIDIGVDPAGGTSYTTLIPNLLAACAGTLATGCGINYYFPIWIKSGSSVAARGWDAGGLACSVICRVFGKPRDPSRVRAGTIAQDFGTTNNVGTAVTCGTSSEGSWTSIASAISKDYWWWQIGMSISDTTMGANNIYHADLAFGDASNKHIIIADQLWHIPTNAEVLHTAGVLEGGERYVKNGNNLYVRAQVGPSSADSNVTFNVIGVGG